MSFERLHARQRRDILNQIGAFISERTFNESSRAEECEHAQPRAITSGSACRKRVIGTRAVVAEDFRGA